MAFPLCFRTLEHFGKSFKANKMVKSWVSGSLSLCLVLLGLCLTSFSALAQSCFEYRHSNAECPECSWSPNKEAACVQVATIYSYPPHLEARLVGGSCQLFSYGSYSATYDGFQTRPVPCSTPSPTPSYPCRDTLGQPSEGCTGGNCTITNLPISSPNTAYATRSYCSNNCQFRGDVKHCGNNNIAPEGSPPQCLLMLGVNGCSDTCQLSRVRGTGLACDDTGKPIPDPNLAPPIDTDSAPNPPDPSVTPLPKGKCKGTVNGVEVIVNCVNTKTVDKSDTTKTNDDGSTTQTTSDTVCDGKKCTTTSTTTKKDPTGVTTSVENESVSEDQNNFCTKNPNANACKSEGFCEENPDLPICKNGNWSSTTCDVPPVCEGDPVQCAQAKETYKSYCELEKLNESLTGDKTELPTSQSIVDAAIGNANSMGEGGLIPSSGDPVGVGSFDQTNPWGSTCPSDRTVAAFEGHNIEFKLSEYCSIFQLMGTLAVAFTLLAAGLFVFKD